MDVRVKISCETHKVAQFWDMVFVQKR